ncbi:unnamed protein product [Darwinula stevensoni]|uniref:Constitutive coactivator of PPAR-gamma-like protein 1 homolog n=1 Tax=Darwinula stevensoni TaxID=69355 RepID=A0A7R9ACN6_9CRUS|nr:unnamed protein product [Darwinula stevensoni]CAG0899993.1 unnamed protein product [Darwinula stevensoni]
MRVRMRVQELQKYIETHCPGACVPVDLLKIARSISRPMKGNRTQPPMMQHYNHFYLVLDGECCLDRLYGGFFSDWVCGGQWNRMVQFLAVLIQTVHTNSVEMAVFFNGSLEQPRISEWIKLQLDTRKKINSVLRHLNNKATPPPKVWWVPPVCLRTCMRMALRHLNIAVMSTMEDHHQEVIAFCRENNFHGLVGEDVEYAIFCPPRYFSAQLLKLTYKGSLETKEYIMDELCKKINIHPDRLVVLAALLGNYCLTEDDLSQFHKRLCPNYDNPHKIPFEELIEAVAEYVRNSPSVENLNHVGIEIFGAPDDKRILKLKDAVQYYVNGTKDGFLRYWTTSFGRVPSSHYTSGHAGQPKGKMGAGDHAPTLKFASELADGEQGSFGAYQHASGGRGVKGDIVKSPDIHVLATELQQKLQLGQGDVSQVDALNGALISSSSSTSTSPRTTPDIPQSTPPPPTTLPSSVIKSGAEDVGEKTVPTDPLGFPLASTPKVSPEVMRTASERHQKGLMSPWIYQILTQGELKIPVMVEDENHREVPNIALLYRPVRQMVYGIIFNLHHHEFMSKKAQEDGSEYQIPDIKIREWVWSRANPYRQPDLVEPVKVGWKVPTVQRLWFGGALDDKKRRLRAFLSCMRSDRTIMLNTSYVPQHLLVLACVLRYIMSTSERAILRKQELDAFIAQAFSPQLTDAHYLQDLELPVVTSRGVQLASMFMMGVESALFANDACGAPIPWLMCCPWLFFDGKLFHQKLVKASTAKNLMEVCEGQLEMVAKVDRLRHAVLDGLQIDFAPRLPVFHPPPFPHGGAPHPPDMYMGGMRGNMIPAGAALSARGRIRTMLGRRALPARGGQLEIAGVVVGQWGPNYPGGGGGRGRGNMYMEPQVPVMAVGGMRNIRGNYGFYRRRGMVPFGKRFTPGTVTKKPNPVRKTKASGGKKDGANASSSDSNDAKEESSSPVKIENGSKGRGITLETQGSSKSIPLSEVLSAGGGSKEKSSEPSAQFEDALPSHSVLNGHVDDAGPSSDLKISSSFN